MKINSRTLREYAEWKLHVARWRFRQLSSASFWRNYIRRTGARLGFYTAWLEADFQEGYGEWTWNPIPQWRRNNDLVTLLREAAANAQARGLDPYFFAKTKLPERFIKTEHVRYWPTNDDTAWPHLK
jgi:hypothetical protein